MAEWKPPTLALKATPGIDSFIQNYLDGRKEALERFNDRLKELAEKIGEERLVMRHAYDGVWVHGFQRPSADTELPRPGWRQERDSGVWVPALRSKLGKEHEALLRSYSHKYKDLPGLPWLIWGEGYMGTWTLEMLCGAAYATISVPLGERTDVQTRLCDVDTNLWERVPLSTYHLAKEAQDA